MTYCANEYREPVTFDDVGINKKVMFSVLISSAILC